MSYIDDVNNELVDLEKELDKHSKDAQKMLATASRSIQIYIGDYGAQEWHRGFDLGFDAGYNLAIKKGKLDKSDYDHYFHKAKDKAMDWVEEDEKQEQPIETK